MANLINIKLRKYVWRIQETFTLGQGQYIKSGNKNRYFKPALVGLKIGYYKITTNK